MATKYLHIILLIAFAGGVARADDRETTSTGCDRYLQMITEHVEARQLSHVTEAANSEAIWTRVFEKMRQQGIITNELEQVQKLASQKIKPLIDSGIVNQVILDELSTHGGPSQKNIQLLLKGFEFFPPSEQLAIVDNVIFRLAERIKGDPGLDNIHDLSAQAKQLGISIEKYLELVHFWKTFERSDFGELRLALWMTLMNSQGGVHSALVRKAGWLPSLVRAVRNFKGTAQANQAMPPLGKASIYELVSDRAEAIADSDLLPLLRKETGYQLELVVRRHFTSFSYSQLKQLVDHPNLSAEVRAKIPPRLAAMEKMRPKADRIWYLEQSLKEKEQDLSRATALYAKYHHEMKTPSIKELEVELKAIRTTTERDLFWGKVLKANLWAADFRELANKALDETISKNSSLEEIEEQVRILANAASRFPMTSQEAFDLNFSLVWKLRQLAEPGSIGRAYQEKLRRAPSWIGDVSKLVSEKGVLFLKDPLNQRELAAFVEKEKSVVESYRQSLAAAKYEWEHYTEYLSVDLSEAPPPTKSVESKPMPTAIGTGASESVETRLMQTAKGVGASDEASSVEDKQRE